MRLAAVSALAGAVVLGPSSAALADDAVTGTVTPGNLHTTVANPLAKTKDKTTNVAQLTLRLSNGKKGGLVYCVDFTTILGSGTYTEGPAKGSIDKYHVISWVLANSLPVVAADDVLTAAKAQLPGETDSHQQFEDSADFLVYVGTQAAIWELSNPGSFRLGTAYLSTLDVSEKQYQVILKVHDYLVGLEDKTPKASLTIAPPSATGAVGTKVGPFTATSGGPDVTLTATGGKLVDKDGKEITSVKDNGQFWVTSDTAGQAKVHGTATFNVPAGRLFFTTNSDNRRGQTVIFPGTGKRKADADATAVFTAPVESASPSPSPSPGLPVTGANVTGAAIGGGVLLLAGVGLVLVLRRRRVKFTA